MLGLVDTYRTLVIDCFLKSKALEFVNRRVT